MAKPIEDRGHLAEVTRPLKLKRYDVQAGLPDPGQCVDSIIIVNDKTKPSDPAKLAVSNGAGWDCYVRESQSTAVAVPPQPMDLMPMVREAVALALQSQPQPMRVIQPQHPPQIESSVVQELSNALLELTDHVNRLLRENAEKTADIAALRSDLEFIRDHAALADGITLKKTA